GLPIFPAPGNCEGAWLGRGPRPVDRAGGLGNRDDWRGVHRGGPAASAGKLRQMIRRGGLVALVATVALFVIALGARRHAAAEMNGAPIAVGELTVVVSKSNVSAVTGDSFTSNSQIRNAATEATPA